MTDASGQQSSNPLEGKTLEEITLHFDGIKNAVVGQLADQANTTMTNAFQAMNTIPNLVNGFHQVISGLASELAVFHEFEHHIRTGTSDLGSLWVSAEQRLEELRTVFRSKAEGLAGTGDQEQQEKENARS